MRRFTLCLLASALAFACSKNANPTQSPAETPVLQAPQELTEAEPNDTVVTGLLIKPDARVTGELTATVKKADEDFFLIEAQGAGKVADFTVEGSPGIDLAIELLDQDGNHLAVFNSEGVGKGERIARLGLTAPYAVKIFATNKGGAGTYLVDVRLGDELSGTENEPNERAVDATPLGLALPIQGWLGDRADEDWYRFEVPVPPSAGAEDGEAAANPAASQPASAAQPPALGVTPQAVAEGSAAIPGTALGDTPAPEPAALDSTSSGEALPADQQPPATPSVPAPPRPALVRLDISPVPGVRLQVDIANEAQAVFFSARAREEGEGIQVRNVALRPGESTFFMTIKSAWVGSGKEARRGYAPEAPYTLTVSQEDSAGDAELESNDEPAKATPFSPTGTMRGYFSPKGDADYFSLRYDQPSLLKIELSGVDRIDSTLSLVRTVEGKAEKDETLVRANDGAVREGEMLVNVAAAPGEELLLKVEPAARQVQGKWVRDQENPAEPYSVAISARADEGLDEREPNDSAANATIIEFGRPLRGLIHPKRDLDLYRLDVSDSPVKVPIQATATGILKVDIALALYRLDSDGKPVIVQTAEKGKGEQPETIRFTVEPGVYLLEVKDTKNWNSNFLDAYQLFLERDE